MLIAAAKATLMRAVELTWPATQWLTRDPQSLYCLRPASAGDQGRDSDEGASAMESGVSFRVSLNMSATARTNARESSTEKVPLTSNESSAGSVSSMGRGAYRLISATAAPRWVES